MSTSPNAKPANSSGPTRSPQRGRWLWLLLLLIVAAGVVAYVVARTKEQVAVGGRRQMPPASVATAVAERGELHVYLSALGTVTPLNVVTVKSRAVGELKKSHFTEGQMVQAGEVLAEIDPRAYQVALEQAEGQLARDRAQLENARLDLVRYQNAEAAVTQQQIDTAKAGVAEFEGAVRADQGAVDSDRLQLSYCTIAAPITGRAGFKLVNQGNLIQTSDTAGIVVLTQEQPISVIFSIPEDSLPQVRQNLAAGQSLPVQSYDRAMKDLLATGTLIAIDNQIDPLTGTVKLRANFPNDDHALFPNQFVNMRLLLEVQKDVILIPNSAIQIGAQTQTVFVVKADNSVELRTVKLGRTEGEKTAVIEGIAAGEVVVADGLDKLQDGAMVVPRPRAATGGSDVNAPARGPADKSGVRKGKKPTP